MTVCVGIDSNGVVFAVEPQPVVVSDCALVLVSGDSLGNSLASLTAEQGAEIAGVILGVWALAFVFRLLIRVLNVDEKGDSTNA